VGVVCLNAMLLCVHFRPATAKSSPKLHSDKDHHLDYLLVTVAVIGQQGLTPASRKLSSLHPAIRSVVNTLGCPGDDPAPVMVVPHHWSEGPP